MERSKLKNKFFNDIKSGNFAFAYISNAFASGSGVSAAVGIAGFALLAFGLYKFRARIVIFSAIIIALSFFISSESFLSKLLYHAPIFSQTRHIERAVFLFAFAGSILAGFGFLNLHSLIERHKKISKNILFFIVIFLIFFELFLMQKMPASVDVIYPDKIPVLEHMNKDTSTFRTINLGLKTFIGATGYNYYSQLGISELKGGSGIRF